MARPSPPSPGPMTGAWTRPGYGCPTEAWLTVQPRRATDPRWGVSDLLRMGDDRPHPLSRRSTGARSTRSPPWPSRRRLPPGGGTAVLNLVASLAADQGRTALAYRGPYPTEQLFLALLESFRLGRWRRDRRPAGGLHGRRTAVGASASRAGAGSGRRLRAVPRRDREARLARPDLLPRGLARRPASHDPPRARGGRARPRLPLGAGLAARGPPGADSRRARADGDAAAGRAGLAAAACGRDRRRAGGRGRRQQRAAAGRVHPRRRRRPQTEVGAPGRRPGRARRRTHRHLDATATGPGRAPDRGRRPHRTGEAGVRRAGRAGGRRWAMRSGRGPRRAWPWRRRPSRRPRSRCGRPRRRREPGRSERRWRRCWRTPVSCARER